MNQVDDQKAYILNINVSAMVSTGIQRTELSNLPLAKTFNFVLSFHFKAKSKDLVDFVKSSKH